MKIEEYIQKRREMLVIIDECPNSLNPVSWAARMGAMVMTPDSMNIIMADAESASNLEELKEQGLEVIVMDSMAMDCHDFSALEKRMEVVFGHEDQMKPLRTLLVGTGFHGALHSLRGLGKSFARDISCYVEPEECWYGEDKYNNWKDFIQNPARPGRQIKKQKPPKQSFKAQMRSVNRNR